MTREEAIKLVKRIKGAIVYTEEEKEAIETLIPELRESEDERIRKCICMALTDVDEQRFKDFGTTLKDCLAYLEKQKEEGGYEAIPVESTLEYKLGFKAGKESEKQKESLHISETCKENADSFTDEDERIRKIITDSVFLAYGANDEYRDVLDYLDRCGLEKQKEPENTSASTMIPSCWAEEPSLQKEQNPLTDFEAAIYSYLSDDTSGKFDKEVMHKCAIERAKILLELARKEQKPAEWSEEDEKIVNNIVSVLGQYIDYKAVSGTGSGYATPRYAKEIAWLKSLRPHWKPSKDEESKK